MSSAPTDAGRGEAKGAEGEAAEGKPAKASGGGMKAFLPLIIALIAMPALAFVTTNYLILPKIKAAMGANTTEPSGEAAKTESTAKEGEKKEGDKKEAGKEGGGKAKISVPITKILVNVAGTMGTRYLMTSFTLVGSNGDLKAKIDENKDQLLDLATSTLSSKTIADLEKPGSRNIIRNELMTVFNNALGGPLIQEIYITEMAIQ